MLALGPYELCIFQDLAFESNSGTPPEGGNTKNSLCCPLHFSIPGKGPLPVCFGRPSIDRHALLQVLLAGEQLLLLDQQALDVGLNLHVHLQILTPMTVTVKASHLMRVKSRLL